MCLFKIIKIAFKPLTESQERIRLVAKNHEVIIHRRRSRYQLARKERSLKINVVFNYSIITVSRSVTIPKVTLMFSIVFSR